MQKKAKKIVQMKLNRTIDNLDVTPLRYGNSKRKGRVGVFMKGIANEKLSVNPWDIAFGQISGKITYWVHTKRARKSKPPLSKGCT